MRRCSRCGIWKPPSAYPPRARICVECIATSRRLWARFAELGLPVHNGERWVLNAPKRYE